MSRPSLLSITAVISAGMLVGLAAPSLARLSAWLVAAGVAVGCVLVCIGCWMAAMRERYERMEQAHAQARLEEQANHENQVLERLSRLEPHQTELIAKQVVRLTLSANPRHPITHIELTGLLPPVSIPLSFAQRVMRDSTEIDFAPQRLYSGQQRQWHQSILEWCKVHGMIDRDPAGNQPAKWRPGGYSTACVAFSLADGGDEREEIDYGE